MKAHEKATGRRSASQPAQRTPAGAGALIAQRIRELAGWRGRTLARMRGLIRKANPGMTEEWKWNNPVWSHHGIVCTGEAYKSVVKLTFARGAALEDPSGLFNASLAGHTRRAIDIREGETVDARAFGALVKAAVAHNRRMAAAGRPRARAARPVKLLSGGTMGGAPTPEPARRRRCWST